MRYRAGMASMHRWLVPIAVAGCDVAHQPEPAFRSALAVCETPTEQDAVECDMPEALEPAAETPIDPALDGDPFLISVDALVRAGPEHMVAVGTYGDMFPEGTFAVAIDGTGAVIWSDTMLSAAAVTAVAAVGDDTGVWFGASDDDGETLVRRYDLGGAIVAEATVADFTVASMNVQPAGAVSILGTSGGDDAYVGLAADGAELWNGATNQAEGVRVEIHGGIAQYFEGPGSDPAWEVDPRGEPQTGFPIDVGFERAIITSAGDVLAIGETLGPLGDNTLFSRISSVGQQGVSMGIPRALAEVVLEGAENGAILVGRSFHCVPGTYLSTFDAAGVVLQSNTITGPPSPWVVDTDGRVASVAVDDRSTLILRAYEVES